MHKHFTNNTYQQPKNGVQNQVLQKAMAIAYVANSLLEYMEYYDAIIPYEYWKNKKDICYLTKQEYNIAVQTAIKKDMSVHKDVFKTLKIRNKS